MTQEINVTLKQDWPTAFGKKPNLTRWIVPKETEFKILPNPKSNTHGLVTLNGPEGEKIEVKISYETLSRLFPEEFPDFSEEEMEQAIMDGELFSVTGNQCYEVDGHDEYGWPAKTLAYGMA